MSVRNGSLLRVVALLASGVVAVLLGILLVLYPEMFRTSHPIGLVVMLILVVVISFWQAHMHYRRFVRRNQ